ncbi:MAG: MlaD family protein [Spongiibacteraceae bacterium]
MSNKANPLAIGGFVVGIVILAVFMTIFFGKQSLFADTIDMDLVYKTSVKGLGVGAPVTLRGVKIGEVTSIKTKMYTNQLDFTTIVTVKLDSKAMEWIGSSSSNNKLLAELLAKGFAAQLKTQSILTGLLYIDVDFYQAGETNFEDVETDNPQFPTVKTNLEAFTQQLEKINTEELFDQIKAIGSSLQKTINNPDFEQIGYNMNSTLSSLKAAADNLNTQASNLGNNLKPMSEQANALLEQLNRELPILSNKLNTTLDSISQGSTDLQRTLNNTDYLLSDDSPLLYQLNESAKQLEKAATAVESMADTIDRNPESLLRSKRGQ